MSSRKWFTFVNSEFTSHSFLSRFKQRPSHLLTLPATTSQTRISQQQKLQKVQFHEILSIFFQHIAGCFICLWRFASDENEMSEWDGKAQSWMFHPTAQTRTAAALKCTERTRLRAAKSIWWWTWWKRTRVNEHIKSLALRLYFIFYR